ncbi:hypothetical protein [Scleromatobacter humisilvae]|uniref:Uncharacterized protein n=1 Tax=Scleromatobacter humisilvae TaxID=2897159 RepID=A0A9X1YGD0_9BURK|nr:hypothetical protein [Scleromatobacter humisilvae]MCK9684325.1 hypothetical protein [Scleromatobacter humisilvae]
MPFRPGLMRRTGIAGLAGALAVAASAAPRSADQVKHDQAWLAALTQDLHDDLQRRKDLDASKALRRLEHLRLVYDRTSVAHVIVQGGAGGTTVHVSEGWIALAEDVALADLVARSTTGSTMSSQCNSEYLNYIATIVKSNRAYERGDLSTPQAIEDFHRYVDADHPEATHCRELAAMAWRDTWRPRWLEVRTRVEAGLLWWMSYDLNCRARVDIVVPCPFSGAEDRDAIALVAELGTQKDLEQPVRLLRLNAFSEVPN